MLINKEHPLNLYTRIFDKDKKEHFFTYIDIKDKLDKRDGYISQGEEFIHKEGNDLRNAIFKHWHCWEGNPIECPFDFFIDGIRNPNLKMIQVIQDLKFDESRKKEWGITIEEFVVCMRQGIDKEKYPYGYRREIIKEEEK